MVLKPETVGYGSEYSQLSNTVPSIEEIGLDDFVSQYYRLWQIHGPRAPDLLDSLIVGVKSRNSKLHFGITLYEDDLQRNYKYLSDPILPASIRNKVDYVHFYLHYRASSVEYPEYLNQAQSIFPHAQMIAGVYAYDRLDYLPCAPNGHRCSPEEEMRDFNRELDSVIDLLKKGSVSWIEFYPGFFGREQEWPGWSDSHICGATRKQACIQRTKEMRRIVAEKLNQLVDARK